MTSNTNKPTVIGLFGIPGAGKTTLLQTLEKNLDPNTYAFYEGSNVIDNLVEGGIAAFKAKSDREKTRIRERAINSISEGCKKSQKVGIVVGHAMFWSAGSKKSKSAMTMQDLNTYTHIIYLDTEAAEVERRIAANNTRPRERRSAAAIRHWQQQEDELLRRNCYKHKILLASVNAHHASADVPEYVRTLIESFTTHTEKRDLRRVESEVDSIVSAVDPLLETMVIVDADKTLAPVDTEWEIWFQLNSKEQGTLDPPDTEIFDSDLGYTHQDFRQCSYLYEEIISEEFYENTCQQVAKKIELYPEMRNLLDRISAQNHVGAVIVTCSLQRTWELVLQTEPAYKNIRVLGNGRLNHPYIISPLTKEAVVQRLRSHHDLYVWAFGDSPLDLPMLRRAQRSVIVVGNEEIRSKSMEHELDKEPTLGNMQQVLLRTVSPRLDVDRLPVIQVWGNSFENELFQRRQPIYHATDKEAGMLLQTPMRDATLSGPALRGAHGAAGAYLAREYVTKILGLEDREIEHVQGNKTKGHELCDEEKTVIVPLMRGGEPMAMGVSEAFPKAAFFHAKHGSQIEAKHLKNHSAVILFDAVINTGKSIEEFVKRLRDLSEEVRIVIVAGVVQAEAVRAVGVVRGLLGGGRVSLVALRLSMNKYKGQGGTDTGHRLFNTVYLDESD